LGTKRTPVLLQIMTGKRFGAIEAAHHLFSDRDGAPTAETGLKRATEFGVRLRDCHVPRP